MSNVTTDPGEIEACWLRASVTLLAEALDASETGIDVDDGTLFVAGDVILIDHEEMLVSSVASNTLTVTRQYNDTTAATHADNTAVGLFKKRRFKLTQALQPQAVDRFPGKVTIGDYSKDSNDILSAWVISDLTGGHGVADLQEGVDDSRYRFGTIYTRYPSQWSKPFSITKATLGSGSVFPLGVLPYGGTNYRMVASGIEFFQDTTDRGDLTGVPSDKGLTFRGTGSQALFYVPQGNNGYSTFNPATNTLTNNNGAGDPDVQSFVLWDEKLIAIDNDGTISYATAAAGATTFTAFTLGGSDVRLDSAFEPKKLHAFRNAAGEQAVHVVTDQNVWVFDADTPRLRQIPNFEGEHPYFGVASCVWRGELYVSAGMDILAFNGDVIRNVGVSRDDGLPWAYQGGGYVRDLVAGQNALYALVRGVTTGGVTTYSVHEWSGFGWCCIYASYDADPPVRALVSRAGGNYRLHWGLNGDGDLFTQELPVSYTNPREAITAGDVIMGDFTVTSTINGQDYYTQTYYLETGRFNANMQGYRKIARGIEFDVRSLAENRESIKVYYRIDSETSWTQLGATITASGMHQLQFGPKDPNGHYVGIDFEQVELRFEIIDQIPTVGYIQATSAVIESATLSFLKRMNPSLAWTATIDAREEYHDANMATLAAEITELRTLNRFFSIRHRSTTYQAMITGQSGSEEGGLDTRGIYQLSLIEIPSVLGLAA